MYWLLDLILGVGAYVCPLIIYLIFITKRKRAQKIHGIYTSPGWNFLFKKWWSYLLLKKINWSLQQHDRKQYNSYLPTEKDEQREKPQLLVNEDSTDTMTVFGADQKGSSLYVRITRRRNCVADAALVLKLDDGSIYTLPAQPNTAFRSIISKPWSVAGLKLQICKPFEKWRITFNGFLRAGLIEQKSSEADHMVHHVRLNFIWTACSAPLDLETSWTPGLLSESLAREPWKDGQWIHMMNNIKDGYGQWGTLHGTLTLGDSVTRILHLRGLRQRSWGLDPVFSQHRRLTLTGMVADGTMYMVTAVCYRQGLTHALFGYVREPNGLQKLMDSCDLLLPYAGETPKAIPDHLSVTFSAGGKRYISTLYNEPQACASMFGGYPWNCETHVNLLQCNVNGASGVGVAEYWYRYNEDCPVELPSSEHLVEPSIRPGPLVVTFSMRDCQSSAVVGGKGAPLALITSLRDPKLVVPPGFCLTVRAFEQQLQHNKHLQEAVMLVEQISHRLKGGSLQLLCERTVSLFESTPVHVTVRNEVLHHLEQLGSSQSFAVRSSAIGEDSEDLSAAGQNATFLGVHGESSILEAIQKCWGSLYTFQSVQYRRHHGQPVKGAMAVIVQTMVAGSSAGVLFTWHPTLADPTQMLLTANFGLGESVVSAMAEPDTIILSRDWRNNLAIKEVKHGSKKLKITLSGLDVVTEMVQEDQSTELCVSHEEVLALGLVGLQLETLFHGPRDIEWVISEGNIYVLQSRPITTLDPWTEFELIHELDSPVPTDDEIFTTANTGEVMPGALTPLTSSILLPSVNESSLRNMSSRFRSDALGVVLSHHHVMLNMLASTLSHVDKKITLASMVSDLAIHGHLVTTDKMHCVAVKRNGVVSSSTKLCLLWDSIMKTLRNRQTANTAKTLSKLLKLDCKNWNTASAFFEEITHSFETFVNILTNHMSVSSVSIFTQIIAVTILAEGNEELSAANFSDFALLLSTCSDIISAEIPTTMKEIAAKIRDTGRGKEFCAVLPSEALTWLDQNAPGAAAALKHFLIRHGHRGLREFDFFTETWGMKPDGVLETIQTLVATTDFTQQDKKVLSVGETIQQLKSPQKNSTRKLLEWILPLCRRAVAQREDTKASLITAVHTVRLAYRHLAELMVCEGRLPEPHLIFFLTHYEVQLLLRTRNPVLLAKAARRQRLWSQWNDLTFPEIIEGLPTPVTMEEAVTSDFESEMKLQGTAVYPGTIKGRACVVIRLEETSQIQNGDVLITHSTDVGWSPYFPLLGGVVTELGGLISHGAVVAREYGLPCVVGVSHATKAFHTGDIVLLNGASGTIQKVDTR